MKDFKTSEPNTYGISTPPRAVMMLRLPQQTHHGLSLASVLLALVWLLRIRTVIVSEGEDEDEYMSLDLAELQRTP